MQGVYLQASLCFYWDARHKLWRVCWRDNARKPLGRLRTIETSAPLDAFQRRELLDAVTVAFGADLFGSADQG